MRQCLRKVMGAAPVRPVTSTPLITSVRLRYSPVLSSEVRHTALMTRERWLVA